MRKGFIESDVVSFFFFYLREEHGESAEHASKEVREGVEVLQSVRFKTRVDQEVSIDDVPSVLQRIR